MNANKKNKELTIKNCAIQKLAKPIDMNYFRSFPFISGDFLRGV